MAFMLRRAFGAAVVLGTGWSASDYVTKKLSKPSAVVQNVNILERIEASAEYKRVASSSNFKQARLIDSVPESYRQNHVALGLLFGQSLFETSPILYINRSEGELVGFYYIGSKLNDQYGKLHNGILGLLLDEGLCFCGFSRLPSKRGVTGKLAIEYVNQVPPNTAVVVKAKVKESKGRKVVIDGWVETMNDKVLLAKAHCILVEPKWFKYFSWLRVFDAEE